MKRFLAVLLAVITVFSLSAFAFAYENVDNTFDSFTPAIGKVAPANWYDPCCYDGEGLLRIEALSGGNLNHPLALYCKENRKIFTTSVIGAITKNGVFYDPYSYKVPSQTSQSGFLDLSFCPYCGAKEEADSSGSFGSTHIKVYSVAYGANCPTCGLHNISYDSFVSTREENNGKTFCLKCKKIYRPEKFTRYISKEMQRSEYSFIFTETAHKYGNGKDCLADDLILFAEDDIYLRPEDVPKKDQFSMAIQEFFNSIWRWLDKIYNKFLSLFK